MDRAFLAGAAGSAPAAPASPSIGYPTGGVPGTTPPTEPGPYWFHMITEELRAVVAAGGLTPSQATLTQVRDAILAMVTASGRPGHTYGTADWAWLDKAQGLMIQWCTATIPGSGTASFSWPIAFPTALLTGWMTANGFLPTSPPAFFSVNASGGVIDTAYSSDNPLTFIIGIGY